MSLLYNRASTPLVISFRVRFHRRTRHSATTIPLASGASLACGVARTIHSESKTSPPTLFEEFSLAGKVALVTGANRGLGLAGALALAEVGARVVYCVDIADKPGPEWSRAREFVSHMRGSGGASRFEYIRGDVSDQEGMWDIGKTIGDREGRLDVCLAAAGISGTPQDTLYVRDASYQEVLDVNLKGLLYTAQAAGQQMVKFGNGGSIILVASIAGNLTVNIGLSPYEISKGGVLQMTRSLACELAPQGIRVNSISPGFHKTPMLDKIVVEQPGLVDGVPGRSAMKRLGEPRELRGAVAWLASSASSFCTGSDIVVDGGYRAH